MVISIQNRITIMIVIEIVINLKVKKRKIGNQYSEMDVLVPPAGKANNQPRLPHYFHEPRREPNSLSLLHLRLRGVKRVLPNNSSSSHLLHLEEVISRTSFELLNWLRGRKRQGERGRVLCRSLHRFQCRQCRLLEPECEKRASVSEVVQSRSPGESGRWAQVVSWTLLDNV